MNKDYTDYFIKLLNDNNEWSIKLFLKLHIHHLDYKKIHDTCIQNSNNVKNYMLGILYYYGLYVKQSYLTSLQFFSSVKNLYDSKIKIVDINLHRIKTKGIDCAIYSSLEKLKGDHFKYIEKNYSIAIKNYMTEINKLDVDPTTYIEIGDMYYRGMGVEKNFKTAIKYFQMAINNRIYIGYRHIAKCIKKKAHEFAAFYYDYKGYIINLICHGKPVKLMLVGIKNMHNYYIALYNYYEHVDINIDTEASYYCLFLKKIIENEIIPFCYTRKQKEVFKIIILNMFRNKMKEYYENQIDGIPL